MPTAKTTATTTKARRRASCETRIERRAPGPRADDDAQRHRCRQERIELPGGHVDDRAGGRGGGQHVGAGRRGHADGHVHEHVHGGHVDDAATHAQQAADVAGQERDGRARAPGVGRGRSTSSPLVGSTIRGREAGRHVVVVDRAGAVGAGGSGAASGWPRRSGAARRAAPGRARRGSPAVRPPVRPPSVAPTSSRRPRRRSARPLRT